MEITGIHVFEKRGPIEWEDQIVSLQALSALSWRKFHGKIKLYTNPEWLAVLRERNVDVIYDEVHFLSPDQEVDQEKFWAWSKIKVAAQQTKPFVMLDTDLWINQPLKIDEETSLVGYHYEWFDETESDATYIDFRNIIPREWLKRWDSSILPINAALVYFKDLDLVKEWFECAKACATQLEVQIEDPHNVRLMCFIEQRLLAMLAAEKGISISTFIPQIYISSRSGIISGQQWWPHPEDWDGDQKAQFGSIRHIWGGKKIWKTHDEFREAQWSTARRDANILFGDKYTNLISI